MRCPIISINPPQGKGHELPSLRAIFHSGEVKPWIGHSCVQIPWRKDMRRVQWKEAPVGIHGWEMETKWCIKSVQRVHGAAGSRCAPLAVHDLLFVERRKRLPRKVCPAAIYILPCLCDLWDLPGKAKMHKMQSPQNGKHVWADSVESHPRWRPTVRGMRQRQAECDRQSLVCSASERRGPRMHAPRGK